MAVFVIGGFRWGRCEAGTGEDLGANGVARRAADTAEPHTRDSRRRGTGWGRLHLQPDHALAAHPAQAPGEAQDPESSGAAGRNLGPRRDVSTSQGWRDKIPPLSGSAPPPVAPVPGTSVICQEENS